MNSPITLSDSFDFSAQDFHYRTCGCEVCRLRTGGNQQNNGNQRDCHKVRIFDNGWIDQ